MSGDEGTNSALGDVERLLRAAEKRGEERARAELKRKIQEYTRCCVCQSNARDRTHQCHNGHITCQRCVENVNNSCPMCRYGCQMARGKFLYCRCLALWA